VSRIGQQSKLLCMSMIHHLHQTGRLIGHWTPKNFPFAVLWIIAMASVQGCDRTDRLLGHTHPALPPDFAMRFHVSGDAGSDNLLRKTSQYVIEPNRSLRTAFGSMATIDSYPDLTRRSICRAEFYDLSQHVYLHHLMAEPTSMGSKASNAPVRYEVELTTHGQTHRYATTASESPPTVELLRLLVALQEDR